MKCVQPNPGDVSKACKKLLAEKKRKKNKTTRYGGYNGYQYGGFQTRHFFLQQCPYTLVVKADFFISLVTALQSHTKLR